MHEKLFKKIIISAVMIMSLMVAPRLVYASQLVPVEQDEGYIAAANLQIDPWYFTGGYAVANTDMGAQFQLSLINETGEDMPEGYLIELYISEDATIDGTDMLLDNGEIEGKVIPAGSLVPIIFPSDVRIPAAYPAGPAYLGVNINTSALAPDLGEFHTVASFLVNVVDPGAPYTWTVFSMNDYETQTGTLRHAITHARSGDTISIVPELLFTQVPQFVVPETPLPEITQGNLRIVNPDGIAGIDGSNLPAGSAGLVIASDGNHISGLTIQNVPGDGLRILGNSNTFDGDLTPVESVAAATTVSGPPFVPANMVNGSSGSGIFIAGDNNAVQATAVINNGANGILIVDGASNNTIGGAMDDEGNQVSGNQLAGVRIEGASAQNNQLFGNYIGLTIDGVSTMSNAAAGVVIAQGANNNQIGGAGDGEGNLISGNSGPGIILQESNTNMVRGNLIGVRFDAQIARPNNGAGIRLENASNNQIGGTSFNSCNTDCNLISGNQGSGIFMTGANSSGNVINGNTIGLLPTIVAPLPNNGSGIEIRGGAHDNVIGGATMEEGNNVAGNMGNGVMLWDPGVQGNLVQNNRIGGTYNGFIIGNGAFGVVVRDTTGQNQIGGEANQANSIEYNNFGGVWIENGDGAKVLGNTITHNGGDPALPKPGSGILIRSQSSSVTLYENDILENFGEGILATESSANQIQLNNVNENGLDGIVLDKVNNTDVVSNTVNENDRNGIYLSQSSTNLLRENTIENNGSLPNDATKGQGIYLYDVSRGNIVEENGIRDNMGDGVRIEQGSDDNPVRYNELDENDDHGIAVYSSVGISLSWNIIENGGINGIYLLGIDGSAKPCVLDSNTTSMNGRNGIELEQTNHCIITTNTAGDNGDRPTADAAAINAGSNTQNGISLHTASHHNQVLENTTLENYGSGIRIANEDSNFNVLQRNTSHNNVLYGVEIVDNAQSNRVQEHTIFRNQADGIRVEGPETLYNRLSENSIVINGGLAIENTAGGNIELAPPEVDAIDEITTSVWAITGTTCPNCVVEVFTDFGHEAVYYEGTTTADVGGSFVITGLNRSADYFALTARDVDGNTSELSIPYDMEVIKIEVTQAIQSIDEDDPTWDNWVRLTGHKPSVVRVHVRSNVGTVPRVNATLDGHRGLTHMGTLTPNDAACPEYIEVQSEPNRDIMEHAFCFVLPSDWIEPGELDLSANINTNQDAPEKDYTHNNLTLPSPVEFKDPPNQPRLRFFRVKYRQSLVRSMAVEKGYAAEDDIASGDINGDGRDEIVVASASMNHIAVYTTNVNISSTLTLITVPVAIPSITFGDGYDLEVGNVDSDDAIEVVVEG